MASESEGGIDYGIFLADLEAKRAALDNAIASVRALISAGAAGRVGDFGSAVPMPSVSGAYGSEVPAGAFLGKSIPESTKLFLSIVKSKKTTREIADALRKGGMETTSGKFEGTVHAGLNRSMKATGDFVRVGNAWALREWYPAGIRGSQEKREKRKPRKAKRRRADERVASVPALPEKNESQAATGGHHPTKLSERAIDFINSRPKEQFTAKQLSEQFGIHPKVISMTLGRPVKQGLIKMSAPGTYAARQN